MTTNKPGQKIRKTYRISMSKKFPEGSLLVVTAGTEIEEDGLDSTCEYDLWRQVYDSTMSDLKEQAKTDPLITSVMRTIYKQIKAEIKVAKTERVLKNG